MAEPDHEEIHAEDREGDRMYVQRTEARTGLRIGGFVCFASGFLAKCVRPQLIGLAPGKHTGEKEYHACDCPQDGVRPYVVPKHRLRGIEHTDRAAKRYVQTEHAHDQAGDLSPIH
jgi:hypothetical protein